MEKHLVVSVGEEVYVALAKGPLNAEHVLILPITHYPAGSQLPDNVWAEVYLLIFLVCFILPFYVLVPATGLRVARAVTETLGTFGESEIAIKDPW